MIRMVFSGLYKDKASHKYKATSVYTDKQI